MQIRESTTSSGNNARTVKPTRLLHKRRGTLADVAIGQRIRAVREARAMSQSALGQRVGVTYQQIQKYEVGANRIAASMLVQVAEVLTISASDLLGMRDTAGHQAPSIPTGDRCSLIESYYAALPTDDLRNSVINLLAYVAKTAKAGPTNLRTRRYRAKLAEQIADPMISVQRASIYKNYIEGIDFREPPAPARGRQEVGGSRLELSFEPSRDANRLPTGTDVAVGRRIRDRRLEVGMTQADLARQLGVSAAALSRYENGLTRVAASRLIAVSEALGTKVQTLTHSDQVRRLEAHALEAHGDVSAEVRSLVKAFANINSPALRGAVIEFARAIGSGLGQAGSEPDPKAIAAARSAVIL